MTRTPLTILTLPDRRLRQPAAPVDHATLDRLRRDGVLDRLVATMRAADGVGIAATQVGIPHRIIVVLERNRPVIYVNPAITARSIRTEVGAEGCLSVPDVVGMVRRAKSVTLRARTADDKPVVRKVRDLTARIVQHEVDHLDGVLFIDRAIQTSAVPADASSELRV